MNRKSYKSLNCKICGEEVKNVGGDATAVTCWRCVSRGMRLDPIDDEDETELITNKTQEDE